MASYTVAGSKHATLAPNVVDVVTLTNSFPFVEIHNRSQIVAQVIWFRLGTDAPTVAGDDTIGIAPGERLVLANTGRGVVRLIAGAAAPYSVRGVY